MQVWLTIRKFCKDAIWLGLLASCVVARTGIATDELTDDQNIQHSRNQRRRISPLKQLTLGYQKNWSPLENVAPVVFDTDPALAQQLNKTESVHSKSQSNNGDAMGTASPFFNRLASHPFYLTTM